MDSIKEGEFYIAIPRSWINNEHEHPYRTFIYTLLSRDVNKMGDSVLLIDEVVTLSGKKVSRSRDLNYQKIVNELMWMQKENYIKIYGNYPKGLPRTKLIRIHIIDNTFKFIKLDLVHFEKILSFNSLSKEDILRVYLYISNRYVRIGMKNGESQFAQGCFDTIKTMSQKTHISKYKLARILNMLTEGDNPLIIKRDFNKYRKDGKYITSQYPNVYLQRSDTMEASFQAIRRMLFIK